MTEGFRRVTTAVLVLGWTGLAAGQPSVPSAPDPAAAPAPLPPGRTVWTSQDGSVLDVDVDATGALTGTLAPGFPCGASPEPPTTAAGAPRPVVGTVAGNAVAWTVTLPECPSVGTWIGHYQIVGVQEQLRTLWTLALVVSPPGVGSTYAGADVFVRQPAAPGAPLPTAP